MVEYEIFILPSLKKNLLLHIIGKKSRPWRQRMDQQRGNKQQIQICLWQFFKVQMQKSTLQWKFTRILTPGMEMGFGSGKAGPEKWYLHSQTGNPGS